MTTYSAVFGPVNDAQRALQLADVAAATARRALDIRHPFGPAVQVRDPAGAALVWTRDDGTQVAMTGGVEGGISHPFGPDIIIADAAGTPLLWQYWGQPPAAAWSAGGGGTGDAGTVVRDLPGWIGNIWGGIDYGSSIRWMSDIYGGRVMGFERRGGIDLAQSGDVAVGMVAYGGGMGTTHALPEAWRWHVRRPTLAHQGNADAAEAQAALAQSRARAAGLANPTVIAITSAVGSPVEADLVVGSAAYNAVLSGITQALSGLATWGKVLTVDRIEMSLLGAAQSTSQAAADLHYASVANELRGDIVELTGQGDAPLVVVSQSFGTRTDGASTVALAEAVLDRLHPTLGFVVVGPRYPYALASGSPSTLTAQSAALLRELMAYAVAERQSGRQWYCPEMQPATRSGATVTAPFNAMTDLVLADPANHGFTLEGVTNGVTITAAAVSAKTVTLTLSGTPTGTLFLRYAWGRTGDPGDGRAANRGSLRDGFAWVSEIDPTWTHYRHALAGRVTITGEAP